MGRFRHGPESARTRDRGSGIAVGIFSLDVARNDPGYWLAGGSTSRTWPFSRPAGPSSAADSRSGYGGPTAASGRCSPRRASRGSCPSGTTPASAPRSPSRSACACTRHALRSSHTRCSRIPAAGSARALERGRGTRRVRRRRARPRRPAGALRTTRRRRDASQCPRNLLAVSDRDALVDRPQPGRGLPRRRLGARARGPRARGGSHERPSWARPSSPPAPCYLALVAAWFASSLDRGALSNGTLERRLWLGQAAALVVLAARGRVELGSEPPCAVGRRAARRRARPVAPTRRPAGRSRRIGRRSRARPRLPARADRPAGRRAGPPGRARGRSPGADETRPRRARRGRARAHARPARRRATRRGGDSGCPARARERAPTGRGASAARGAARVAGAHRRGRRCRTEAARA